MVVAVQKPIWPIPSRCQILDEALPHEALDRRPDGGPADVELADEAFARDACGERVLDLNIERRRLTDPFKTYDVNVPGGSPFEEGGNASALGGPQLPLLEAAGVDSLARTRSRTGDRLPRRHRDPVRRWRVGAPYSPCMLALRGPRTAGTPTHAFAASPLSSFADLSPSPFVPDRAIAPSPAAFSSLPYAVAAEWAGSSI